MLYSRMAAGIHVSIVSLQVVEDVFPCHVCAQAPMYIIREKRTDTTRRARGWGRLNDDGSGVGGGAILFAVRCPLPPARQSCTRAAWSRSSVVSSVVFRVTPVAIVRPSVAAPRFRVRFYRSWSARHCSTANRLERRTSSAMWRTALLAAAAITLAFDRFPAVAQGSNTFIDEQTNLSSECEYIILAKYINQPVNGCCAIDIPPSPCRDRIGPDNVGQNCK